MAANPSIDTVIDQFVINKLKWLKVEKEIEKKRQEQYPRFIDLAIGNVIYNDAKCNITFSLKNRSIENIFNNGQNMKCEFLNAKKEYYRLQACVFRSNDKSITLTFLASDIKEIESLLSSFKCKIAANLSTISHDRMIE